MHFRNQTILESDYKYQENSLISSLFADVFASYNPLVVLVG